MLFIWVNSHSSSESPFPFCFWNQTLRIVSSKKLLVSPVTGNARGLSLPRCDSPQFSALRVVQFEEAFWTSEICHFSLSNQIPTIQYWMNFHNSIHNFSLYVLVSYSINLCWVNCLKFLIFWIGTDCGVFVFVRQWRRQNWKFSDWFFMKQNRLKFCNFDHFITMTFPSSFFISFWLISSCHFWTRQNQLCVQF